MAYTDPSGFLNEGGSQYSTNNAMAENTRLRAMYSDAVDAIYAAANASGAGNMYGIWEEGKLSIYTYSDIGNFREIGSVNEAMKANSGFTGSLMTDDAIKGEGTGKDFEKQEPDDWNPPDYEKGGFFNNKSEMIRWMHLNSELKHKEMAGWELIKGNATEYYMNGWKNSECNYSWNDWSVANAFKRDGGSIKTQYHTENTDDGGLCKDPWNGPSFDDYEILSKMHSNYNTQTMYIIEENNVYKLKGGVIYEPYNNYYINVPKYWSGHTEFWDGN